MKLSNKQQQPIRLWFEYLKVCLKDEELSKKVNRKFYKDWHLNLVKTLKFNKWIKTHHHLFTIKQESVIKLYEGKRTPNTILVEIPVDYTVQKIQRYIGQAVKGKIAKPQSNQRFQITSKQNLKIAPFDYFRYCWQIKRKKQLRNQKIKLTDIWYVVDRHIRKRQSRLRNQAPWLLDYESVDRLTGKITVKKAYVRIRKLSQNHEQTKAYNSKAVVMANNIRKAQNILENVCKGVFPGDYSIS